MTQAVASAAKIGAPAKSHLASLAPKEFLTFRLGAQEYGIDAYKVREIRGCGSLEGVDDAPFFIRGAIEIGAARVPIVDMRSWFGLDRAAEGMFTVAVILNLDGRELGIMVDSVSDVIRLARGQIRPTPESGPQAQYLIGVGVDDDRRLILLDIEVLMLGVGMRSLEIEPRSSWEPRSRFQEMHSLMQTIGRRRRMDAIPS